MLKLRQGMTRHQFEKAWPDAIVHTTQGEGRRPKYRWAIVGSKIYHGKTWDNIHKQIERDLVKT